VSRMGTSDCFPAVLLIDRQCEVPASFLAFDVLCLDGTLLLDAPYRHRCRVLEGLGLDGRYWQTPPAFTGRDARDCWRCPVSTGWRAWWPSGWIPGMSRGGGRRHG
jgi:hypothetical protein